MPATRLHCSHLSFSKVSVCTCFIKLRPLLRNKLRHQQSARLFFFLRGPTQAKIVFILLKTRLQSFHSAFVIPSILKFCWSFPEPTAERRRTWGEQMKTYKLLLPHLRFQQNENNKLIDQHQPAARVFFFPRRLRSAGQSLSSNYQVRSKQNNLEG